MNASSDNAAIQALAAEILGADIGPASASQPPAPLPTHAPTMGNIVKLRYSHEAMIDLIIASPAISQNELAMRFGYTPAWISNIFASDAFRAKLAERRKEVIDPTLVATIEERFRGLAYQSLEVLKRKLDEPAVKAEVALRAAELGAKALGLGGHAPPAVTPVNLDDLAKRLVALNPGGPRVVEGEVLTKEITP